MKTRTLRSIRRTVPWPGRNRAARGLVCVLGLSLAGPLAAQSAAETSTTGSPATPAGRLVTTAGQTIETQGDWRVDGRRVIYTDARGQLASIRTSEIDLERSHQPGELGAATSQSDSSDRGGEVAPALVLDDGDVSSWNGTSATRRSSEAPGDDAATQAEGTEAEASRGTSGLELVSWKAIEDQLDRVIIHGTVLNPTRRSVREIRVRVVLLDERGEPMRALPARMVKGRLAPGETSNFQARFGEFVPYTSVDILIEGNA